MKGILGKKLGMTQVFTAEGNVIPVTVIEAGPCVVLQKKDQENDGYEAIQIGFSDKKEKRAHAVFKLRLIGASACEGLDTERFKGHLRR